MQLQKRKLMKHLLNKKFKIRLTFADLFPLMYLEFFLIAVRGLERRKWPGPLWTSERPYPWIKLNVNVGSVRLMESGRARLTL
jgi:hypothetical protein